MCKNMRIRRGEYERIRDVLSEADPEEPLTAREILDLLEEHGEEFDSAHRVATVLGRQAEIGDVEVIQDQPYRYRLGEGS
jgi:predicted Zn-ribbon and HTH transcriptional regulator